ncbi:MAG: 4-hydroxy-tetrahydrodipicolinate synthase [Clostridia bacterium]|nr:4-hydroxy-tetrahydrodipicolinate synthase [Clostridia bacterium]
MTNKPIFTGSGVALVTPFNPDFSIDFDTLGKLVEYQIENGTDCIIACGTTGESATLDDKEHLSVIEYVVKKVDGRIPVVAGTGSNDTRHGVALCREAAALGADGLLTVTPYYNKTSQTGLIKHFDLMASASDCPMIVYNVPGRTGLNVLPETMAELSKHENIVGIKEASGNLSQVAKLASLVGDKIDIYSGNDDQNVPILSLGGVGTISVLANVAPRKTHDMIVSYLNGDVNTARALQLEAIELIDALFVETNPIPVKKAVELMGLCPGTLRMPLYEISDKNLEILKKAMTNYGIL